MSDFLNYSRERATTMSHFLAERAGFSPVLSSKQLDWEGIVVEQRHHPAGTIDAPPLGAHLIAIYNGAACPIVQKRDGRTYKGILTPGHTSIVPTETKSYWAMDGVTDVLNIDIMPSFIERVAVECNLDPNRVELANHFGVFDPRIKQIGCLLKQELQTGGMGGKMLAESLANALVVYLLRQYSANQPQISINTSKLSRIDLQQATSYIHDNLDADLSLTKLAEIVNLSKFHFARSFKQTTGISPHQYVIRTRVEKAKQLLATGKFSVGEVASFVGFAHQSHLASHMKRTLGVLPKTILQNSKNLSKSSKNLMGF